MDLNAEDNSQETPLHIAVRFNNEAFLDHILSLQKNEAWKEKYGAALLEIALLKKNQPFLKKLIDQGIDVNVTNNRGSTPLEIARRIKATSIYKWLLSQGADVSLLRNFELKGDYLGQKAPGLQPKVFAPNFISTEESEFGSVFNADASEFFYAVDVNGLNETRYSKLLNNQWTDPVTILSHERYGYNDPFLSLDEQRLYFISKRALDGIGELKDQDIWYVEREKDGWSDPINAGPNINSDRNEYYISFTNEGTMYFSSNVNAPEDRVRSDYDIYYSKFKNGSFQKAVRLGPTVNTPDYEADVFVAPDESYIIFCATRADGLGRGDLYISFKKNDGSWSASKNMGAPINSEHHELCPFVTKDGKYLFYTSNQDIYWVDAKIIEEIKNRK